MLDLPAIKKLCEASRHRRWDALPRPVCLECQQPWPCDATEWTATAILLVEELEEAQARLRKANCEYGDGWLNDDLECGIDVEPWCGKHAVLYYIKAHKEAQRKLDAVWKVRTAMQKHRTVPTTRTVQRVLDPYISALARILKESK